MRDNKRGPRGSPLNQARGCCTTARNYTVRGTETLQMLVRTSRSASIEGSVAS
jgi:hypothetical protein